MSRPRTNGDRGIGHGCFPGSAGGVLCCTRHWVAQGRGGCDEAFVETDQHQGPAKRELKMGRFVVAQAMRGRQPIQANEHVRALEHLKRRRPEHPLALRIEQPLGEACGLVREEPGHGARGVNDPACHLGAVRWWRGHLRRPSSVISRMETPPPSGCPARLLRIRAAKVCAWPSASGTRGGIRRATCSPRRVMTISSPRAAHSTSSDRRFLASKMPTVLM